MKTSIQLLIVLLLATTSYALTIKVGKMHGSIKRIASVQSNQGSIGLSWDASPSSEIVGYNIYYGTATHSYTNMISVGNVTNTIVSGLVAGVTYYFAATATGADGNESDYSEEVSIKIE